MFIGVLSFLIPARELARVNHGQWLLVGSVGSRPSFVAVSPSLPQTRSQSKCIKAESWTSRQCSAGQSQQDLYFQTLRSLMRGQNINMPQYNIYIYHLTARRLRPNRNKTNHSKAFCFASGNQTHVHHQRQLCY